MRHLLITDDLVERIEIEEDDDRYLLKREIKITGNISSIFLSGQELDRIVKFKEEIRKEVF